ncbi:MAG TPA: bifunctional phosphoribosylaminoimidazolecarboxamide formyltransferase/IMP cyclohydrolase [Thermoanaerobaculia bacterium]|nr:bifunctional phosphoribosylaminoimidazolecarboxamide formyltransferase/IMP cyclohydrolase [Thermoanaerobaculia bacterium]
MLPVRRALISVYDKQGLGDFAAGLAALGVEIVSTGGTARHLEAAGIEVVPVSDVTGFPEILGGRVKSLHPMIHGGILANRARSSDAAELQEHGIEPIGLVVVNLYPFQETVKSGAEVAKIVEMIDIGGPAMIRAAAKNFSAVTAVVDPADYPQVLANLERGEELPASLRRRLAAKAFRATQRYDAAIAEWMEALDGEATAKPAAVPTADDGFPPQLLLDLALEQELRYGENPHQPAAVYSVSGGRGLFGGYEQLQGKALSYNNLLDADAARRMVALFDEPAVAVVKHNNPCGLGRGETLVEAYERALSTDPVSAFGSIVAVNRKAEKGLAEAMRDLFVEVVVAPGFGDAARQVWGAKANLRLLACPPYEVPAGGPRRAAELRAIEGGFLAQMPDAVADEPEAWTCPTTRPPSPEERRALEFAWKAVRAVKSNAVVVTDGDRTLGIGAGQMSRVDSCRLALQKAADAGLDVGGAVAASDAFFPFADGLEVLAEAGVTAVVQPGGSKRDDEVVAAADEHDVAMLFTGRRHFRH